MRQGSLRRSFRGGMFVLISLFCEIMSKNGRPSHWLRKYFEGDEKPRCAACSAGIANGRTSALRVHYDHCEKLQEIVRKKLVQEERKKEVKTSKQFSITEMFDMAKAKDKKAAFRMLWTLIAVRSNLSASFLASSDFSTAIEHTVTFGSHAYQKRDWSAALESIRSKIVQEGKRVFNQNPVCLILDGWRISFGYEHAHAFLISDWTGRTFFHKMVGDLEKHDSKYLVALIEKMISEIEETYGTPVTSIVSDNAGVMLSSLKQIGMQRPIAAHPCASHWLQLLLNDIALQHASVSIACEIRDKVIQTFRKREFVQDLRKASELASSSKKALAAPCTTRWSSEVDSMISLLKLENPILTVLRNHDIDFNKDGFALMRLVVEVLIPIANATDVMQSTSAGILGLLRLSYVGRSFLPGKDIAFLERFEKMSKHIWNVTDILVKTWSRCRMFLFVVMKVLFWTLCF
jgi:hypothetical protein